MNKTPGWMTTQDPQLATSRTAANQERGVLAVLRALAPRRKLATREAELVAELQANRLIELAGMPQAPIPNELITELPRIAVRLDPDLPASGSAHWASGRWLLTVNASEPWTRQRFSLCHELKHVIDHRHVGLLYANDDQAEHAADIFAACLLMPKRYLKSAWGQGAQSLSTLSTDFGVSPVAMARRLEALDLRSVKGSRMSRHEPGSRKGQYRRRQAAPILGVTVVAA